MRGDVWWFEPPHARRRAVVILTRDEVIPHLNHLLAAPTTTRIRSIPTEVELDQRDGMPAECVISLDNLLPVRRAFLTDHLTTLHSTKMAEVCRALARAVAC
ncbi:MAG: type II toxin-antitoxin system PemK/MazF family toxin [Acidimicrobiia bacterium]|nr:type II toxin-antitoxin system PemK/MazF family toxin [Acidimicrobiia bacterium]